MTENKHTPGPWKVIPPDKNCDSWFVSRDRLETPPGIVPEHFKDGRAYYIACFRDIFPNDNAEANARLIAAAPELLEKLERVVRMLENGNFDEMEYMIPELKPIIARVRGE